jgi:spermidine/putrescine transport system permease protein
MPAGREFSSGRDWTLRLTTLATYAYLYAPIAILVVFSFNASRLNAAWQGFTWEWYVKAWRDAPLIASVKTSLRLAFATMAISTVIGTLAALALGRRDFRSRTGLDALFHLPIVIPEIVIGFASVAFFGAVGFRLGDAATLLAHVAFSLSYVTFVVRARLSGMDEILEQAALDLGATPFTAFRRITLPLIAPAALSAALLAFTISLDDYIITSFTAGPGTTTLPLLIYSLVKTGVTPEINAVSAALLAVTLLFVFTSQTLINAERIPRAALATTLALFGGLGLFALRPDGGGAAHRTLNVYIWSNYLSDKLIRDFEARYKVTLNVETYDSNEALLAKLQTGLTEYDIIAPSDYMVGILIREGLLRPLDRNQLTNLDNLDESFLNRPFDPDNRHSIPYTYLLTGIGYRRDKISKPVESWSVLWDTDYRNRIAMLDDIREAFGAALRRRGRSINSVADADITDAARLLAEQKPLVKTYDSATFDQLLLTGEVWLAQGYSGQIAKAARENPNIAFVIPKEGGTKAIDNLAIPRNAPHPDLAMKFIDYILEPEASAEIVKATGYGVPNRAARNFIPSDRLEDPAIFPPREILRRCEFIEDVGPAITRYDYLWTEIKSQ